MKRALRVEETLRLGFQGVVDVDEVAEVILRAEGRLDDLLKFLSLLFWTGTNLSRTRKGECAQEKDTEEKTPGALHSTRKIGVGTKEELDSLLEQANEFGDRNEALLTEESSSGPA